MWLVVLVVYLLIREIADLLIRWLAGLPNRDIIDVFICNSTTLQFH